jgi:hypothetical protein
MRLEALSRVKRKELTVVEAAGLMRVSVRQARRLWKRFRTQGAKGLAHRLRGCESNRRLPEELRERIVKRHQERYADFGPTLACEKLAEDGLVLSPDTLVAVLKERHLWQRRRRRGKHRKRRERRAHFGSMVQMDGSRHDWFEGRAPWCVLMVAVDDATGRTLARFYPAETTAAAFDLFGRWVRRYGVPHSVYVDRHSIYRDEEHPDKPTQFSRAMRELDVELICARSPQAKGRVERKNAVFQDRLVKELRLRGISDLDQANALLDKWFLDDLNRRYAITPKKDADLHRPAPPHLEEILCVQEPRTVGRDWCVRWDNRFLQVETTARTTHLAGKRVLVKHLADGRLLVTHGGQTLTHRELATRPQPPRPKPWHINNRRWKPGPDHPWKREGVGRASPGGKLGKFASATPQQISQVSHPAKPPSG